MTVQEFLDFDGENSDLSDLDILPLLFSGCPSTDRMVEMVSLFRRCDLDTLKRILVLSANCKME